MIGYIKGQILASDGRKVIVLTQAGVGYEVYVPLAASFADGSQAEFYVYSHVRQDTFELYGLTDRDSKKFFETLIGINGVGPKLALDVLSMPIAEVRQAIELEDVDFLKQIKGLGKKTAERMILELKGKLPDSLATDSSIIDPDILAALENLGYKRKHVAEVLKTLPDDISQAEDVIKFFLQNV